MPQFTQDLPMHGNDFIAREVARAGYVRTRAVTQHLVVGAVPIDDAVPVAFDAADALHKIEATEKFHQSPGLMYDWVPTSDADASGDPQLPIDQDAHGAMAFRALELLRTPFGEEDRHRKDGGPTARGRDIRKCLDSGAGCVILDPIDGSKQLSAMGQSAAYANVCLEVPAWDFAFASAAMCLGDGRMFSTDGRAVYLTTDVATASERGPFELDREWVQRRRHFEPTWIIPAYKRDRIAFAHNILSCAPSIQIADPLGGNPGIAAGLLGAGALAAWQPSSWAWDQVVYLMCSVLELPVMSLATDRILDPSDLLAMWLGDMVAGRKSVGLVVGKTIDDARELRKAVSQVAQMQTTGHDLV